MAKQNAQSAVTGIQSLFDPRGYQDVFKTFADMNSRMTQVAIEAGNQSTDIAHGTAKETVSNLRDATQVRDEPADYGKAYSDFVQKQMELAMRTAQSFANVTQKVSTEAADLTSKAGEHVAQKTASNIDSSAQTATAAVKKAS